MRIRSVVLALAALSHSPLLSAADVLVSSRFSSQVLRYDGETGAPLGVFASGNGMANPNGIAFGPDGHLYSGNGDEGVVLRYDGKTGAFLGRFVFNDPATPADEIGGLTGCRDIRFGPDGDLYVAAGPNDKILRYEGKTGAFKGVAAEGAGMSGPVGLDVGPDGTIYVGGALSNAVYLYRDGALVRRCSDTSLHGSITGVLLGPDDVIYAATAGANSVVRFRASDCQSLGRFDTGAPLSISIYLAFGPDGHLLAGSFANDSVVKLHRETGASLGTFVAPAAGGLNGTHDIAVMPEERTYTRRLVVPGVARTGGAGGSFFRTTVWLTNPTDDEIFVRLRFHPGSGFGAAGAAPSSTRTLAPHTMSRYGDVLTEAFGVTGDTAGILFVEVAGEARPLVTARTFNDTPGGTFGQYIVAQPVDGGGREANLFGLDGDAASRTNLGVVNLTSEPATASIALTSAAGFPAGGSIPTPVPAETSFQVGRVNDAASAGVLSGFAARVTSDRDVIVYASKLDNVTSDPIYITPTAAHTEQWIDGVGSLAGSNGTRFRTTLTLANPSSTSAAVQLDYVPRGASQPAGHAEVELAPFATSVFGDTTVQLFNISGSAGYLRIRSSAPVVAWGRTFNDRGAAGTLGQFIPGIGAGDLIPLTGAILQGLSDGDLYRTNAGLLNTSAEPVDVTIILLDAAGTTRASATHTVAASQTLTLDRIARLLDVAPIDDFYLVIRPSRGGAVYAWASFVDNRSTDQTFVRPLLLP